MNADPEEFSISWETISLPHRQVNDLMSKTILLLPFLIFFSVPHLQSQTCQDATVELTADVQASPPRIILNWTANAGANQHFVYRKLKTALAWGDLVATLPGTATQYTDSTAVAGVSYEYRVTRSATTYNGYGYINAGIEIAAIEDRGTLILVIDSTVIDTLSAEIDRLVRDLEGDGWRVVRFGVSRTAAVTEVKAQIKAAYQISPGGTKAVFLLGHVPVPYSGELNPDAHPDHLGAWPADVYYADVNGLWTDAVVNNVAANDPRTRNVPGDGKFDQSALPNDVDMQIGRVDFANMPAFTASEIQLLKNYLEKNHRYRHRDYSVSHQMLIDDNFGFFGNEAFAANGWKATPLVGMGNVEAGDYFTDLSTKSYLWSYGCGGGSYTSAGGIGTTQDFAASFLNSVFTMLFGSYFGDWDSQNNFLRAPLAQGTTLANVWAGRPHWMFHHMGLGETIGYSTRLSQNNNGLYFSNFGARGVHMALMGDPTLRNDVVAPVSEVVAMSDGTHAYLSWKASPDTVLGYHVYLRANGLEGYTRINQELIIATSYVDSCLLTPGIYSYMVRALVLQHSPSGTYYNASQGIADTLLHMNDLEVLASATWIGSSGVIYFENTSLHATAYYWDFGDGESSTDENPDHTFGDGEYAVTLIASNACDADTVTFDISISTAIENITNDPVFILSPNPSSGKFRISLPEGSQMGMVIYNMMGEQVFELNSFRSGTEINLTAQPAGIYLVVCTDGEKRFTKRLVIQG